MKKTRFEIVGGLVLFPTVVIHQENKYWWVELTWLFWSAGVRVGKIESDETEN